MNYKTIKQLCKDVIIAERIEERISSGGIYFPENVDPQKIGIMAKVLMIGSKFRFKDDVKVGDVIIVSKYLGNIVDSSNESIRFYDGEDILSLVSDI